VVAGQLPANGNGDGEGGGGEDILVFTAASTYPQQAWTRLAGESSAWVVLANANDVDSLRSTRADLEFIETLGNAPFVVATYMSMAGEEMPAKQIARRSASKRRPRHVLSPGDHES
jgi:hypothetical protein